MEKERDKEVLFLNNSCGVRKSEWEEVGMKEERNEDGGVRSRDSDMRFRLWLRCHEHPKRRSFYPRKLAIWCFAPKVSKGCTGSVIKSNKITLLRPVASHTTSSQPLLLARCVAWDQYPSIWLWINCLEKPAVICKQLTQTTWNYSWFQHLIMCNQVN